MLASWWPLDPKEMDLVVIWGSRVVPLRLASLSGTNSKGKYFVYLNYFLPIIILSYMLDTLCMILIIQILGCIICMSSLFCYWPFKITSIL